MPKWSRWVAVVAALACSPAARAQVVHGTVVADASRPVSGVVVTLVSGAKEVGRSLTNDRGEYRLTAPAAGTYRLRTLRIGFQSLLTEPFALAAGEDVIRHLAVSTVAFTLDTVRATGRNTCKVLADDSTSVVGAIWDQVRSALIATQLTQSTRTIYATALTYERMQDVRSQKIGSQSFDVRADFVRQPWRSLSADSLRKSGYVYTLSDSTRVYNAPDLSVLLSDEFLEDHCLRISKDSDIRRLGIDFQPTPARRNTPEVRGTVWLDRRTNELSELEYGYINRIRQDEEKLAGGTIAFTRMKNGMWAISRWNLRMPSVVLAPKYSPTFAVIGQELRLDSLKVTGGELVMATTTGTRRDTIWMRPPLVLRGTVVDSLSGTPVPNAIVSLGGTIQVDTTNAAGAFTIGGMLPGRYALNVNTPSLDSVNASSQQSIIFADSSLALTVRVPSASMIAGSVCGGNNTATRLGSAIISGHVATRDAVALPNARVTIQWEEITLMSNAPTRRVVGADTRTDARGDFRICGLHWNTPYTIYARTDSGEASPSRITLAQGQRFARVELTVDRAQSATSTFTGVVVDSAGRPLAETDVLVTDVARSASTGADGSFRIQGLPAGSHTVTVRKVGYGPLDATVDFIGGAVTDRRIVLTRITVLDSVSVTARQGRDPNMDEFEERRRIGIGHFVTRDEIVKREGALTSSFLGQMPQLRIATAQLGDWPIGVGAKRCTEGMPDLQRIKNARPGVPSGSRCEIIYVPSTEEARQGVPIACFSKVYLDNALMNPGTPTPPFNLRDIPPTQIEAMEYYARPAEVPMKYANLNSGCGVIVIHTRRP
jgi:protocatechuate 3,4-dioxygenase beta subunit